MKTASAGESVLTPPPLLSRRARAVALDGGHDRLLAPRLPPLIQATTLEELTRLVAATAQELTSSSAAFLVLADSVTQELDASSARDARGATPRAARDVLAGAVVQPQLVRGAHVKCGAAAGQEGWLLVPCVLESQLQGALAIALPLPEMPQSRAVEALRGLCRHATPLVARAREMEALRALASGLATLVHEGARQEERLRETEGELQTARSMQALRAHLIGSVNHALRTPLVALRGYTRLLRRGRDGQWTADEAQYLDVIARNVERMIDVARNLWLPQRTTLALAPLDLRKVWRRAHERTGERAGRITAHVPDGPVRILGDPDPLAHMLAELAVQRLDRLPPDSGLLVTIADGTRTATLTLSTGASGDGQPGAEDEDNGRWFDPLREIANLHGGQIVTRREPGQGPAFVVTLPRLAESDSGEI